MSIDKMKCNNLFSKLHVLFLSETQETAHMKLNSQIAKKIKKPQYWENKT